VWLHYLLLQKDFEVKLGLLLLVDVLDGQGEQGALCLGRHIDASFQLDV